MEVTSLRAGVDVKFSLSLRGRPPPDFFLPDVSTFAGPADAVAELLDALACLAGVLDFGVVVADDLEVFFGGGPMRARQAEMGAQWGRTVVNVGGKMVRSCSALLLYRFPADREMFLGRRI